MGNSGHDDVFEIVEDGFSLSDVIFDDDTIDDISEIKVE